MQVGQELEIEGGAIPFQQDLESSVFVTGGIKVRF
jgi:hypothetical protein